jgi:hypothetical protein
MDPMTARPGIGASYGGDELFAVAEPIEPRDSRPKEAPAFRSCSSQER